MEDAKQILELPQVIFPWKRNTIVRKVHNIKDQYSSFYYKITVHLFLDIFNLNLPCFLVGTILESSPLDQRKDIQSERPGSSDDSDSICSFTHSYNSLSEGSYELAPWHGKLSMSWESIGPDVMSSNLFLAPENAGKS